MKFLKIIQIGILIICYAGLSDAQPRNDRAPKDLLLMLGKTGPDTNRIKLQLELGYHYIGKPGAIKTDIDSAFALFKPALQLSTKLNSEKWKNESLKLLGEAYLKQRDFANGKDCFIKAINSYKAAGREKDEAFAWMRYGLCLPGNDTSAIKTKRALLLTAYVALKKLRNITDELEALRAVANEDINLRRLDLAETEYLQIVAQSKGIHNRHLFYVYSSLGDLNKLRGDLRRVLFYRIEAVKTLDDPTDIYRQKLAYYKLGQVYFDLNMFQKSLAFYEKGLSYKQKAVNVDYRLYMAYVRTLIALNRSNDGLDFLKQKAKNLSPALLAESRMLNKSFALCYAALKQFDKAEECYLQTLNIDDRILKKEMVVDVQFYISDYSDMCDFFIAFKQYKKAGLYIDKLFQLNTAMVNPIAMSHALLIKFKVDSAAGNYVSAIEYYEKHTKLNEAQFNEIKSQQISELAVRYETAVKEKSIIALKSQEQTERAAYSKVSMQRNLTLGGVFFLLFAVILVYKGYRHNRSNNLRLQKKQFEIHLQNNALLELNEKQRHLLTEKEWLLREIHHRVKNNLQTTMSLLNMQSSYLSSDDAIEAIRNSQRRMYSMSLVHQTLYRSDNVATINMKVYIDELVSYLNEGFQRSNEVKINLMTQPIELDIALAIPIGLIINEAVTNALKYAFPDGKSGHINVRFEAMADDNVLFAVSDDGIGLPDSSFLESSNSLGLNLIKGLTEQIGGQLEMKGKSGTSLTITFKNIIQ